MAIVHVAFCRVGARGDRGGQINIPLVPPRISENVTTSTASANTVASAQQNEIAAITVPSGADVWVSSVTSGGTLDLAASNSLRIIGPGTAYFGVDAGDVIVLEDVS